MYVVLLYVSKISGNITWLFNFQSCTVEITRLYVYGFYEFYNNEMCFAKRWWIITVCCIFLNFLFFFFWNSLRVVNIFFEFFIICFFYYICGRSSLIVKIDRIKWCNVVLFLFWNCKKMIITASFFGVFMPPIMWQLNKIKCADIKHKITHQFYG